MARAAPSTPRPNPTKSGGVHRHFPPKRHFDSLVAFAPRWLRLGVRGFGAGWGWVLAPVLCEPGAAGRFWIAVGAERIDEGTCGAARAKMGLFLGFCAGGRTWPYRLSDMDDALFGEDDTDAAHRRRAPTPARCRRPARQAGPLSGAARLRPAAAPVATITPVAIERGQPIPAPRSTRPSSPCAAQVAGLQRKMRQCRSSLADLRNQGAGAAGAYQEAKAHITTRLQVGTTRGNPELVGRMEHRPGHARRAVRQYQCPECAGHRRRRRSPRAHFALDQIQATFNVSGAVDEDHRQLRVLEDETNQTIVLIDRLLKEVSDDIQRQTAYVANERANLTTLAAAIKNGEFYGADRRRAMPAAPASQPGRRPARRWS